MTKLNRTGYGLCGFFSTVLIRYKFFFSDFHNCSDATNITGVFTIHPTMTGAFFLCTVIRQVMVDVSHILNVRYKLHNETIKEKLVSICSKSTFSTNFPLDQCKYNWRA